MIRDAKPIYNIISEQAEFGHILPRAISEHLWPNQSFSVYTGDDTGGNRRMRGTWRSYGKISRRYALLR